jgi:hypothetical protein
MRINKIIKIVLGVSALTVSVATSTQVSAVTIVNAGFNDQTGWDLRNDATLAETGGTAGWSWTTPVANVLVTSTETITPPEGTGMGITYGGGDAFTQSQSVEILTAGVYDISVEANALTGNALVSGSTRTLGDGTFALFAGSASSPTFDVITTDDWMNFTWRTTLDAGFIDVGLRNRTSAIYSIAFDDYSVTLVPVPAAVWLFGSGLIGLIGVARRKKA